MRPCQQQQQQNHGKASLSHGEQTQLIPIPALTNTGICTAACQLTRVTRKEQLRISCTSISTKTDLLFTLSNVLTSLIAMYFIPTCVSGISAKSLFWQGRQLNQ
jgi:hypothetical protein